MTTLMPYRYNRHLANRSQFAPFDDLFRSFFGNDVSVNAMRVDVKDEGDHYLLEADMPGIKKENVNIEIDDGVLTISAEMEDRKDEEKSNYIFSERRSGKYTRSFTLNGINEDNITASCEDGVLKLTLPKQTEEVKGGRKIEIK